MVAGRNFYPRDCEREKVIGNGPSEHFTQPSEAFLNLLLPHS